MTTLCVGSAFLAIAMAFVIPFLPFACALFFAMLLGAAVALFQGESVAIVAVSSIALSCCAYLGYAMGMLIRAWSTFIQRARQKSANLDHRGPSVPSASGLRKD